MSSTLVVFYQDQNGDVPLLEWLDKLREKSKVKVIERIRLLSERGHDLRRPHADYLRDNIYELQAKDNDLQLRILYFFDGKKAVILSHGFIKNTDAVPTKEIDKAIVRMKNYLSNPDAFTFKD